MVPPDSSLSEADLAILAGEHAPTQLNRETKRAGFKRARKTYRLRFAEGSELAGLEMVAGSLPLGEFLELTELADIDVHNPADLAKVGVLFKSFATALKSWNLEQDLCRAHRQPECKHCGCPDHGELVCEDCSFTALVVTGPVPPTLEGVKSQDYEFMLEVIGEWMTAIGGVPAPLGQRSAGGVPSVVASLPMAPLSPSQAS
jgi:hypothetical protein